VILYVYKLFLTFLFTCGNLEIYEVQKIQKKNTKKLHHKYSLSFMNLIVWNKGRGEEGGLKESGGLIIFFLGKRGTY